MSETVRSFARIQSAFSRAGVLIVLGTCAGVLSGCTAGRSEPVVRSTPAAPVWEVEEARETLRALRSATVVLERSEATPNAEQRATRVADYLSAQMRRYGVQPGAEGHRLHYLLGDGALGSVAMPLMVGLVAGRDPLDRGAVVVYAPLNAERAATRQPLRIAASLELARVFAQLGETYRFPARTLIFVIPVGNDHADVLRSYGQQPIWPMEHIAAVLTIGVPEANAAAWHAAGVPDAVEVFNLDLPDETNAPGAVPEESVIALARRAYAWLLPYVGASLDDPRAGTVEGE